MNHTSNASGITQTTNICSDDYSSSNSIGMSAIHSNGSCATSMGSPVISNEDRPNGNARILNYKLNEFVEYRADICEVVCIEICQSLNILPTTRLLFGIRSYDKEDEWIPLNSKLKETKSYCFRMRFKIPALDEQLETLDTNANEYLYRQMRSDIVRELIPELKYPLKKDNVVGLCVLDMYIDLLERRGTVEHIEAHYDRYLPKKIVKAHWFFVKRKTRRNFRQCRAKSYDIGYIKFIYVKEVHSLAPNYLLERFKGKVEYIPGDEELCTPHDNVQYNYLKLDLHDTQEPGLKIARLTSKDKLKWKLVAKLENIFALCTYSGFTVGLEITGFSNAYRIQFDSKEEMESFITYLGGYIRLTYKWTFDFCMEYNTPSLQKLNELKCHGPIGGNFSFAKIYEKRNERGTYLIRQCEKKYDTYYIDINTKSILHSKKLKTETFKIVHRNDMWTLHYNDSRKTFKNLNDLVNFIPTETEHKFRLKPSEYDKPPLLLICLPKNLLSKKTDQKMSESELQRKRVQVFDPKNDLQWYKNSERDCDCGRMTKFKADWILPGSYGEIAVTLKVLKPDGDFREFMNLTNTWSQIYSPQFIKLYGLTLQLPYTMIMEYEGEALNEFLQQNKKEISKKCLLDVVLGLVRGVVYLQEYGIMHGFIRCRNLYVTNYVKNSNKLDAKIADPGYPRAYEQIDLPWTPINYYGNLAAAKADRTTDFWAFATTVWEIFSYGKQITHLKHDYLQENFSRNGAILPQDDVPDQMYQIIMDGWNRTEPDKRFNHHNIFACINSMKDEYLPSYVPVKKDLGSSLNSAESTNDIDRKIINEQSMFGHSHEAQNPMNYFEHTRQVLPVEDGKVIYKKKDKIGEGHYGTVYLGEIHYDNNLREKVAIKTIKSTVKLNDFMRERKIMETLDHPNIVKIKASIDNPLSIVMEYVQSGSLIVYLTSGKPDLTDAKLLRFALDIAKGMVYLFSKNIIHRDLAARNILVDSDRAKISDFGLAQMVNSNGYYRCQSDREIPIKWYAPEVIKTDRYSLNSDVWSYGVTLFEMFSRGELPNLDPDKEITPLEFLKRLEEGDRLRKPDLCPDSVYEKLMMPCWEKDPKMRPDYKTLINEIQSIMSEENGEML